MSEGGGGGKGKYVLLGVVVAAAVLGWPYLQWFRLTMDIRDAFGDKRIGRFPSVQQIVGFQHTLEDLAKKRGFGDAKVKLKVEPRGEGPVTFWYLMSTTTSGGHSFKCERRIETKISYSDFEPLSEGGVEVPKR